MAKKIDLTDVKLDYVSADLLDFDPMNPRFGGIMKGKGQSTIQLSLFTEPHFASELVDSLLENGFIDYEPLVVKKKGQRFTVVEGNRRLAAIKEIRGNPGKYSGRITDLEKIPVLIFPDQPDEQQQNEMRVYLGVRHLLGFREWPPESKAQFLDKESKKAGGLDQVLKETRVPKASARRFLTPFRLLEKAKEKIPDGEDYWVLGEALSRSGIQNFIELELDSKTLEVLSFNKKNFLQLLEYLYGPKVKGNRDSTKKIVSDTRELSSLAKVLTFDKASTVLNSGKPLADAEIYVDTREQSVKRLTKMSKQLGLLLKKITAGKGRGKNPEDSNLNSAYKHFDDAVKKFVSKEPK